jgi:prophage antirepressor-like protein
MSTHTALVPHQFEGHTIRVRTDQHREAWFVAADVCTVLHQQQVARALTGLREEERALHSEEGPGTGGLTVALISEAGLLRVLLHSDSPTARRMRRWLTHELLPSLHRPAVRSREHQPCSESPQTQTVKAVLRLAKEIIELTGVSEAEAFAAALMDLEANTGLHLAPLRQVLNHRGDAASDQRPRQLGHPHVDAQLDAEELAERLGRTISDTNRRLAACGLQERNDEDAWQLTAAGRDWGQALPSCSRGHRSQQILWDPAVLAVLREEAG